MLIEDEVGHRLPLKDQARQARSIVEGALDAAGWPRSRRLSLWLDALIVLEERSARGGGWAGR